MAVFNKEETGNNSSVDNESQPNPDIFERPRGLKGLYSHPMTQVAMLGFVYFTCSGLYNALNGLGGGGRTDTTTSSNTNVAIYSTLAACAFFAGFINNKIGSRLTLFLGTTGYALSVGSYLALNIHPNARGFVIGSGAVLGLCGALLWTAQGSLMMAYPTEGQKGRFVGIFWGIFNLGGIVGSSVALGQNIHSAANGVGNATYIAFLCMTCIGVSLPLMMIKPENMVRTDGTKVTLPRHPTWKAEIMGLFYVLRDDPMIAFLFPMFLASNWFTPWVFNDYNAALFNIRTRSLNVLVYSISQIVGSLAMGSLLDQRRLSRRVRAFTGWTVLLVFLFVAYGWGYHFQRSYTRATVAANVRRMDMNDPGYPGRVVLYAFFGVFDAMWQTTIYWLLGAMSNDPAKLAHFSGFYKSLQSAGSAGVWRADAVDTPYINIFVSVWSLLACGLVFAFPMIYHRVKEHTKLEDETLARMDDSGHLKSVGEMIASRQ